MKRFLLLFLLITTSCTVSGTNQTPPVSTDISTVEAHPSVTPPESSLPPAQGVIRVDTFEQEIYPFIANGNCSLGEAITAANTLQSIDACPAGLADGSIIELETGTYLMKSVDQSPAVHLDGSPWEREQNQMAGLPVITGKVIINGNGALITANKNTLPILMITYSPQAVINNLTLRGGGLEADPAYKYSYDAGNYWNAGTAILNQVHIENGIADNGAGIANGSGSLELVDCIVTGNTARFKGGGIRSSGSLKITASAVENNAANDGAGITLHAGDVTILNTTIQGNTAAFNSGGILIDPLKKPVHLLLQDSQVTDNMVNAINGVGGGIMLAFDHYSDFEVKDYSSDVSDVPSAKVEIINSKIEDNVAGGGGGIAWAIGSDNRLIISQGSSISNNKATAIGLGGGAIFNYDGNIQIEDSILNNNTSFNGGAIYTRAGVLSITGSKFEANFAETNEIGSVFVATGFGGAIFNEGGQLSVNGTVFTKNLAVVGGAVTYSHPGLSSCDVIPDSFTTVHNSCFISNDATYDASDSPEGDQILLVQCLNPAKNPSADVSSNWWNGINPTDPIQVSGQVTLEPVLPSPPDFCQ